MGWDDAPHDGTDKCWFLSSPHLTLSEVLVPCVVFRFNPDRQYLRTDKLTPISRLSVLCKEDDVPWWHCACRLGRQASLPFNLLTCPASSSVPPLYPGGIGTLSTLRMPCCRPLSCASESISWAPRGCIHTLTARHSFLGKYLRVCFPIFPARKCSRQFFVW